MSLGTILEKKVSTLMLYIPVVDSIAVAIMKVQTVSGALRLGKPNMNTIDLNRNEIPIQIPR